MAVIALPKTTDKLRDMGRLQDIPVLRQLGMFGMVAATIALGLWLFFWTQKPDYVPVFAGLDPKATTDASELLRSSQIPFRIEGGGALAVPADRLGDAKLALASAGLPSEPANGFETMAGDQGFGTSQFIENARYQHALETELARTITNLRPVREARVHLALPKPSAFTRQKEPASASVVLQLQSGSTLEQGQVDAIVHLVASSIPQLAPERVTVVDQFGRMLSNPDPNSDAAIGAKQFEQQRRQEAIYVQRIQELLEPMTGPGRVSAQVSVDMDFSQMEEARERYGPDQVVRSEQVSESGELAPQPPQGVPGAASNTPDAVAPGAPAVAAQAAQPADPAAPAGANAPLNGTRNAVRNFEVDRTLTHTRQSSGRIRRVTAAVLVDNVPAGPAGKDGTVKTRELTPAELQRIETLVQQAIGFNGQRGDGVSVVNAPFARDTLGTDGPDVPLWQHPQARELLRTALGGLAVLLLIFTVLRPAFKQMLLPKGGDAGKSGPLTAEVTAGDEVPVAIGGALPAPGAAAAVPAAAKAALPDPNSEAREVFEQRLQIARNAVNTDPKRVAQVVRDWVESDG